MFVAKNELIEVEKVINVKQKDEEEIFGRDSTEVFWEKFTRNFNQK